jgi:hypothetical protein
MPKHTIPQTPRHRRATTKGMIRRACRVAAAHGMMLLVDGHTWLAMALVMLAALAAFAPHPEFLASVPALAAVGLGLRARKHHREAVDRSDPPPAS